MKNCLSVVVISRVWDVVFILYFCGASGGSTLLILAFHCINGVTKVTQHHLHGYGHPNFFGCAVCCNPWCVDLISGLSFCENQPCFGWLIIELFSLLQVKTGLIRNLCLWPTVFCWAVMFYGQAFSFCNTVWVMFLWKNIHGEHRWHRILKYNYALHVQILFILQSLKCISRMTGSFHNTLLQCALCNG
jgi:hypothetical protein